MLMILQQLDKQNSITYEVVTVNGYEKPLVVKDNEGNVFNVIYLKGPEAYESK